MAESPLFKRAYTRGLNAELIRSGSVQYPSKEAADHAADFVADHSNMPDPLSQGQAFSLKVAHVLCEHLANASQHLCKAAGNQYSPDVTKTAQADTPEDRAYGDAWALMEKSAAETGSLMEGGDEPNTLTEAAKSNAEAALELMTRNPMYANLGVQGVGGYENKGVGTVGHEETAPTAPQATGTGSNSAIENTAKHGMELSPAQLELLANLKNPAIGAAGGAALGGAAGGVGGYMVSDEDKLRNALLGAGVGAAGGAAVGAGMGGARDQYMKMLEERAERTAARPPVISNELGIPEPGEFGGISGGPLDLGPPPATYAGKDVVRPVSSWEAPPKGPISAKALNDMFDAQTKRASLQSIIQKIAAGSTGSLIEGGDNPNTLPAAAAGNAEAALEAKQRPVGYAHSGTGNSALVPGPASQVGTEQSHPLSPAATAAGTNSAIEATSASDPAVKAAAFNYLFTDTARRVVPYLPENMPDATKVAHVQALMAVDEPQRAVYLSNLYAQMGSQKTAAEAVGLHYLKTAEGMPPALREAIEEKKEKHEKGESKEKEKSEEECAKEEEKEAALQTLSTLRSALANLNA